MLAAWQFATILYVIFVGYHKSPEWAGLNWIKTGPWIHVVLVIVDFLVIPLLVVIHTLTEPVNIKASMFTGPLLIYPFISFCIMFQFPVYILAKARGMAQFVKQKREKMEKWMKLKKLRESGGVAVSTSINEGLIEDKDEEERLRKELFTKDLAPPYLEQP